MALMLLSSLKVRTTGVTLMPEPSLRERTFVGDKSPSSGKPLIRLQQSVPYPLPERTPPPAAAHWGPRGPASIDGLAFEPMLGALHLRRSATTNPSPTRVISSYNAHLIGNYHGQSVGHRFHDCDPVIFRDEFLDLSIRLNIGEGPTRF